MNNNLIITIGREYGTGGREIGQKLALRLGVPFYDRELITRAAKKNGFDEKLFEQLDKRATNSFLYSLTMFGSVGLNGMSLTDQLYLAQSNIIREMAEDSSCVIVGRCAEYVLKDYDNVLSVFIHAPHEYCMEQAAKKQSMGSKELERYIQKIDKHRADYHKYYTGLDWTDARNYDLCLDSSKLGFERCVQEIMSYINVRFN